MPSTVRALTCLVTAALIAVACGASDDTAIPDPTSVPLEATVTAAQVTAEPSPDTPIPTVAAPTATIPADTPTPEPTLYLHSSGLACYGEYSQSWHYDFFTGDVVGFPTPDEAATHWWQNESEARWWHSRDGTSSISAEDLTQHPSQDNSVAFRDARGNAQILVYATQLQDSGWIIDTGQACHY